MPDDVVTMDKIVALCKRRGFIFPSSEIYGGLGSTYDYGHYGVLLKTNVKNAWWQAMLEPRRHRRDRLGDPPAPARLGGQRPRRRLQRPDGRLPDLRARFRADHLDDLQCPQKPSKHPGEGPDCDLTEAREFNLMFETTVGPVKDSGSIAYLRPETAQGIFINFKNVLQFSRKKPPFGIAQVGKSFRNEITPGNFMFRTREFEQMEMEFFVPPAEADEWYRYWIEERERWYTELGIRPDHLQIRPHDADELSHYSSGTSDVEYLFPIGWSELEGIANRGDFDLSQHAEFSGDDARVLRPGQRRALRAARDRARRRRRPRDARLPRRRLRRGGGRGRDPHRAQAAPAPRAGEGRRAAARARRTASRSSRAQAYDALRGVVQAEYDEGGSIGKRYRRQDEIGTPYCVTIDHQSLEDGTATVRDRDSLEPGARRDRRAAGLGRGARRAAVAEPEARRDV